MASKAFNSSVPVSVMMDRNSLLGPSCVQQNGQLCELVDRSEHRYAVSGVGYPFELRSYQPKSQQNWFKSLHTKSFRMDDGVYIGGSCNPTQNAAQNNEEHVVVRRNPEVCRDVGSMASPDLE
jgi:phosphatidylserine/phosphatidylglycerophosphate/cardiolipin synthase-like enzyme